MRRSIGWGMAVWFLGLWIPSAFALMAVPRTFDELVTLSELVLIGTVTRVESAWDAARERIYTHVTFSELQGLKGEFPNDTYVLRISGGIVGKVAEFYPGMLRFDQGKRYIIFVRGNFSDIFPVIGLHQGVFQVEWDPERQQEVVRPLQGQVVSEGNSGQLQRHQEALQDSLTVAQFVQRVQERLRALQQGRQEQPDDSTPANPASSGGITR